MKKIIVGTIFCLLFQVASALASGEQIRPARGGGEVPTPFEPKALPLF